MENNNSEKDLMKESKEYVSVSTRLPLIDAVHLKLFCNKNNIAPSEYIRDLIIKSFNNPKKSFVAGINKIKYDKVHNTFNWFVKLDSGQEIEVLSNLSLEFLKNFQNEIQDAINERNHWVHQSKPDSVDVPGELVGGEK